MFEGMENLSIHRNTNSIDIGIYRKSTHTDVTIQLSSNHPLEHFHITGVSLASAP